MIETTDGEKNYMEQKKEDDATLERIDNEKARVNELRDNTIKRIRQERKAQQKKQ